MFRGRSARRLVAVLLTLAVGTAAACGSDDGASSADKDPGKDTTTTAASTGEYDSDAVIRIGVPSPSTILDPARQNNIGQNVYTFLIYDALTQLDENYDVQPMLATEWTFADDGSSLELTLRDDVTFHDGTPFNADAVKVNLERGKNMPGSTIASQLEAITAVTVVDDTTVKLDLAEGMGASLPALFALNPGMMVSPAAIEARGDELATNPGNSGSGAYIPTKVDPGVVVEYERAEDYWDEDAGLAAGLVIEYSSDTAARLNAVRTGAMDLAQINGATPVQDALGLIDKGEIEGDLVQQLSSQGILFNPTKGDMAKPEVRQAVSYAIDREALVEGLFDGNAISSDQVYPEGFWSHSADFKDPYPFDLDKAKALVKEAGGASITITAATGSTNQVVAEAIQAQLAAAGFEVSVALQDYGTIDAAFQAGELESLTNSINPQADPAGTLETYVVGGYKVGQGNEKIATMATEAADPAKSQAERAEIYAKIWQELADEALWIPFLRTQQVWAKSEGVVNVQDFPWIASGLPNLRRIAVLAG